MARQTNIKLRRSATQGAVPTTGNLDLGELALNTYDGKLYMKTTEGSLDSVIQVGSSTDSYFKVRKSQNINLHVSVASKTTDHIYTGQGSGLAYYINGIESPHFELIPGNTYRFDQSHASNSGHPLRLYYTPNKTSQYSTGVTTSGTPGSATAFTKIEVTSSTPYRLYYYCSSHSGMGGLVNVAPVKLTFVEPVTSTRTPSVPPFRTKTHPPAVKSAALDVVGSVGADVQRYILYILMPYESG